MKKRDYDNRCEALREVGCLCCRQNLKGYRYRATGFGVPEIHHLNEDGKAGNERRGDEYTIPLCPYHHRGVMPPDARTLGLSSTVDALAYRYGPSLAHGGPMFRVVYGPDSRLLDEANERAGLTG